MVERPRNEWIDIQIPQIIKKEVWQKAQKKLDECKRISRRSNLKKEYILSSIIKCEECGSYLNGKTVRGKDKDYMYYICPTRNKRIGNKSCSLKTINSEKIETRVWEIIERRILHEAISSVDLRVIIEKTKGSIEKKAEILSNEIENSNKEASRIITLFQKGYINEEEMKNRLDKLNNKIALLRSQEKNTGSKLDSICEKLNKLINDKNIYDRIESILRKMDSAGKKRIINIVVKEIMVSSNRITIKSRL